MPQDTVRRQDRERSDRRVLRLAVRFGILLIGIVFASQGLSPDDAQTAPGSSTHSVASRRLDIHRSEWSALLPSLSPYVTVLAAVARRTITATILPGLTVLALAILWKRWFCRYACPTGLLLELAGRTNPAGRRLDGFPRLAGWLVLIAAIGSLFAVPFFLWLDPLSMFHGLVGALRWPWTAAMGVGAVPFLVVLAVSVIWPGAWCYRLCPLGCVQELANARHGLPDRRRAGGTVAIPEVVGTSRWSAPLPRRSFLSGLVGFGAAGAAWLTRNAIGANSAVLRPPGAAAESLFQSLCTRCGNCIRACPSRIIRPDTGSSGVTGLITPKLRMHPGYCAEGCNECGRVCPSGAIEGLLLERKNRWVIGIAAIDRKRCWPWKGVRECDKCVTICPLEDIDNFRNRPPMPVILAEKCNGCGKCQTVCPVLAIQVTPTSHGRSIS